MFSSRGRHAALVLAALAALTAAPAAAEDLEQQLEDVSEQYARAYLAPFTYSLGPNLNSGIYQTAAIPQSGLKVDFGVIVMGTRLATEDQNFRKVLENVDLGDFDANYAGVTGDIVMSGPTVFGNTETSGAIEGYVDGIQVFNEPGITGLVETRFSPMAVPQASLGGLSGLRATVRWLPEVDLGDLGKTKLFGWGAQWNLNGVVPSLQFDLMVGLFRQSLDVGTLVRTDANSMFVAASKSWPAATLYGGYAWEESEMTIGYTYAGTGTDVSFTVDDTQEHHFTIGATFDVLAKLNIEMNHGELTTYAAGLLFGL